MSSSGWLRLHPLLTVMTRPGAASHISGVHVGFERRGRRNRLRRLGRPAG